MGSFAFVLIKHRLAQHIRLLALVTVIIIVVVAVVVVGVNQSLAVFFWKRLRAQPMYTSLGEREQEHMLTYI